MKKILLGLFVLGLSYTASSQINITESNKGRFGYKHVDQVLDEENGTMSLNCYDPGFSNCQIILPMVVDDGLVFTNDQYISLGELVYDKITNGSNSGRIVFETNYLVSFSYSEQNDRLIYNIYSLAQAQELGLI